MSICNAYYRIFFLNEWQLLMCTRYFRTANHLPNVHICTTGYAEFQVGLTHALTLASLDFQCGRLYLIR